MILIAELSTNHGGDVELAADMIRAAADAGATYAKIQTYDLAKLNPADPQADWLRQAHLDRAAHERLMAVAQKAGIGFLSTPFDVGSLALLRGLGLTAFKIASSESGARWWEPKLLERWFVSYPWGGHPTRERHLRLTAIPLYPTPLECVGRATLLDGWSDHVIGTDACYWALGKDARVLEVHFTTGKGRVMPWDKTPAELAELARYMASMETIRTGVKQQFRDRWAHGA